jgi:hypothetical protein
MEWHYNEDGRMESARIQRYNWREDEYKVRPDRGSTIDI